MEHALTPLPDVPAVIEPPSDYKPSVGDVVDFEYTDVACRGIHYGNGCIVAPWMGDEGLFTGNMPKNVMFTGQRIECVNDHTTATDNLSKIKPAAPTFTGSYAERQKQAVKDHGWKVDSKVKIMRSYVDNEGEYRAWRMSASKRDLIGKTLVIKSITKEGIEVGRNYWPYFVLESAE